MSNTREEDGIDTGSNLAFESRFWTFQRAAWIFLVMLVVVGLSGGFGRGFFSAASLPLADGGDVEFEKFIRFKTPTSYTLTVKRSVDSGAPESVSVHVSAALLAKLNLKIVESTPTPQSVEGIADGVVLVFKPGAGAEALQIKLTLEPKAIGSVHGTLGVSGSAPLQIHQFVYP